MVIREFSNRCTNGSFINSEAFWFFLFAALAWTLFWKSLAVWHAARRKEGIWFIVLMLVNSLGVLDIIYLFSIAKVKSDKLFK